MWSDITRPDNPAFVFDAEARCKDGSTNCEVGPIVHEPKPWIPVNNYDYRATLKGNVRELAADILKTQNPWLPIRTTEQLKGAAHRIAAHPALPPTRVARMVVGAVVTGMAQDAAETAMRQVALPSDMLDVLSGSVANSGSLLEIYTEALSGADPKLSRGLEGFRAGEPDDAGSPTPTST
jgi:hypothetical protein